GAAHDDWLPALAGNAAAVYLGYAADLEGDERIALARQPSAGGAWSVAFVDSAPPLSPPGDRRNDQFAPSVAARDTGEVAVSWVDYRSESWDVFAALSSDGGATFAAAARIDDAGDAAERFDDDPRLVFASDGALLCAWTDVRDRRAPSRARVARSGAT